MCLARQRGTKERDSILAGLHPGGDPRTAVRLVEEDLPAG